jgi:hypothetical protein
MPMMTQKQIDETLEDGALDNMFQRRQERLDYERQMKLQDLRQSYIPETD